MTDLGAPCYAVSCSGSMWPQVYAGFHHDAKRAVRDFNFAVASLGYLGPVRLWSLKPDRAELLAFETSRGAPAEREDEDDVREARVQARIEYDREEREERRSA